LTMILSATHYGNTLTKALRDSMLSVGAQGSFSRAIDAAHAAKEVKYSVWVQYSKAS
jgi:hypothetical protein